MEEFPLELFESPLHRVYTLLQKGVRGKSIRNYARNRKMHYNTLLETIQAIHEAGIEVPGIKRIEKEDPPFAQGVGSRITNKGKSNSARARESFFSVQSAVNSLKGEMGEERWGMLGSRARIALLREKTRAIRGVPVNPQTLYKEPIKSLWWRG